MEKSQESRETIFPLVHVKVLRAEDLNQAQREEKEQRQAALEETQVLSPICSGEGFHFH